jgi:hypothetical protein
MSLLIRAAWTRRLTAGNRRQMNLTGAPRDAGHLESEKPNSGWGNELGATPGGLFPRGGSSRQPLSGAAYESS